MLVVGLHNSSDTYHSPNDDIRGAKDGRSGSTYQSTPQTARLQFLILYVLREQLTEVLAWVQPD